MNDDTFNMELRKFLKKVGITSQREIEKAVQDGMAAGTIMGAEKLNARVLLSIEALDLQCEINGVIALE